ncbi:hypothetical protein CCACVL1_02658 [Corchorus capsularis]|uniref:Uncharacterized protein n=1 Tax=Corchorus capsularis TaxID=210143 RepID=A0A1R3K7A0_COCAP|nr:hypothetical protein CCACVL1_02658 [Corchorus capsularis]
MPPFQTDLRWILPLLLSFLSLTSETKPSFLLVTAFHLIDQPNPTIWYLAFMLLGIFLMIIFLIFSVELELSVTLATPQSPISFQAREYFMFNEFIIVKNETHVIPVFSSPRNESGILMERGRKVPLSKDP